MKDRKVEFILSNERKEKRWVNRSLLQGEVLSPAL